MTDALMKRVWKRNKDTEYGHGMDCQMKMTDALMKRVWKSNKDNEYGHGMDYQMKMTDALIEHNKRKKYKFSKGTHGFKRYHPVRVSMNLSTTTVNLGRLTYFYACQGQV